MKIKFLIGFLMCAVSAYAQNGNKVGYVDADYVLRSMPELAEVETALNTYGANLQQQIQAKYAEYQSKVQDYQQKAAGMSEIDRKDAEDDIKALQERIGKYEQNAQEDLRKKQKSLMEPLQKKIGDAIKAVAEVEGVDVVLTAGLGEMDVVLYASDSADLTDKVLTKLGIEGVE